MRNIKMIRLKFDDAVHKVCADPSVYAKSPHKHFSRSRKLPIERLVRFILSAHTESIPKELMKLFKYDSNAPSASAFVQQRQKLKPHIFADLLQLFNRSLSLNALYKGYRLLAGDGSDIHYNTNASEPENYFKVGDAAGYNLIHLNALYDIKSDIYTDALIQMRREENEPDAVVQMIDRSDILKALLLLDRGYEAYNVIAHIIEKGWGFIIRAKDASSTGIVSPFELPDGSFDKSVTISLTRKQSNETKTLLKDKQRYRLIPPGSRFDYLPESEGYKAPARFYELSFRIVRFLITEDKFETILTNLDEDMFPLEEIKKLYAMRWGIETSFKGLKYTTGMLAFHTRKSDCVMQEILSHMVVYNFCAAIMAELNEEIEIASRKGYQYKANFSTVVHLCRLYMSGDISPPEIKELIKRNMLPVRNNRKGPRKITSKSAISFNYRLS